MKKLLMVLGGLVALLLIGIVVAVLTVKPDKIINDHKDDFARSLSQTLGREVQLGPVESSLFPTLTATLSAVKVAGSSAEAKPQIELGKLEIRVKLLQAILSMGKKLEIDAVVLHGLRIRAARDAEGTWDFQDVLDHLAAGAPPPEEAPPAEPPPSDLSFLEGASLARVALEDARIEIDDAELGRPLAIGDLLLELKDIRIGAPIQMKLHAVLEDGSARTPIDLGLTLAELRQDLSFDPMPDLEASFKLADLALGPWGGLMPASAMAPAAGKLSIDLKLDAGAGLTRYRTSGTVKADGVVLRQAGQRGQPLTLAVAIDADVDTAAPRHKILKLDIQGTGVKLAGTLDATTLTPTGLQNADLSLAVADLARVVAVVPADSPLLPAELTLEGPIQAHVKGDASHVDLALDLDDAHVAWADSFDKKAGRELKLKMRGERQGDTLDIPSFTLAVDQAHLTGSLKLGTKPGAPLVADLSTGPITIASLKQLLPPVAEALGAGRKVDGTLELTAQAKVVGDKQDARASLKLSKMDVNLEGFTVRGSGAIDASVVPAGSTTTLKVAGDFGALALADLAEDGSKSLDKPAGMPLKLDLELVHGGDKADVKAATIALNKTVITAKGGATGLQGDSPKLDLDLGKLDIAFDDLRKTLPGAGDLPAGGFFRGGATVKGSTADLSTLAASVRIDELNYDKARIQGTLGVQNLDRPQFNFDIRSPYLDIDGLLGEEDAEEAAKPEQKKKGADDNPHGLSSSTRELLATVSGQGALNVKRARFKGMDFDDFVGKLPMTDGVVTFEALDFKIYGGTVSAAGSRFDLPATYTGYDLKLKTEKIDLGDALADHTSLGKVFSGLVNKDVDVTGRGLSMDDLAVSLDGPVELNTSALTLQTLDVLGPIGQPLKGALQKAGFSKFKGFSTESGGTTLRDLSAWLKFAKGKFKLKKPVKTRTSFGELELAGGGALDKTLDLTGTALLDPTFINQALGKKVATQAVAVPLKIGGTWDRPKVTGVDVQKLLGSIVGGGVHAAVEDVKDQAKQQVDAAAKKAEAEARKRAEAARKKAEAEVKKKTDAAKALADQKRKEAEAKARAEAEKRKKAAEKKAKAKAKKAADAAKKKARGVLGF